MNDSGIVYNATRTASDFHHDNSFFRLLFGAVGTGKTTSCAFEIFRRAIEQEPARDGIRYSRWAVIRNTYRQLKSTTIKTWLEWFPEKIYGKIKWDSPITHHIRVNDIDLMVWFMPLEGETDLSNLKSLEVTGFYINEMQYLPKCVLTTCLERCDRYPSKASGCKITFTGVIADTNPPDTDHWIYKTEMELPANYKYFHYSPALLPVKESEIQVSQQFAKSLSNTIYTQNIAADYVDNLPSGINYYFNQVPHLTDDEIKVKLCGQYGFVRVGKPVYPEYNEAIHYYADSVRYNRDLMLLLSWDFGLTPAFGAYQRQTSGRIIKLFEITSHDFGIVKFAEDIVIPVLHMRCPGWQSNYVSTADPAGTKRSEIDKESAIGSLCKLGILTKPAKTNNIDIRISAVSYFLRRNVDGKGMLTITKDCPQTRKGFLGDYQFEKKMITDLEEGTKDVPLKNFSSHAADETQYACLWFREAVDRDLRPDIKSLSSRIY
jgi:hypothetical protein